MDPAARTALIVMLLCASALGVWAAVPWLRGRYTFLQACLYLANTFFARVLWRASTTGAMPLPDNQGAVIVSNHRSGIDPLLIQLSTRRVVHWMVAREYYHAPGMSIVFH